MFYVRGLIDFGNQLYDLFIKMLVMIIYIDKLELIFGVVEMMIIWNIDLLEVI